MDYLGEDNDQADMPTPHTKHINEFRIFVDGVIAYQEHSIAVGSRSSPSADRKCLLLKMLPAFRLVIRSQQQYRFGALLVPVDTSPLQPQVHHTSDRTLDRATADRQLQRRDPCIGHPLLTRVPLEVVALALQCLARAGATHLVDGRLDVVAGIESISDAPARSTAAVRPRSCPDVPPHGRSPPPLRSGPVRRPTDEASSRPGSR